MKNPLPLHCLVFCSTSSELARFPAHEVLSIATIASDLVGDPRRLDINEIVVSELQHRVALKLSLGERVVVHMAGLNREHRRQLSTLAHSHGATIVDRPDRHGGMAYPLSRQKFAFLRERWKGITVIGDVHGNLDGLRRSLAWAKSRQHLVWLLGDIINYGDESLRTMELAYSALMSGQAAMILGNHERKIARWLSQRQHGRVYLRLSDGNRVTTEALEKLSGTERSRWIGQFRSLLGQAVLIQEIASVVMTHAAVHPSFWTSADAPQVEQFALYGESDFSTGRYRQTRHWVDAVPAGKIVFVGHEVISPLPTVLSGARGGQVVFLDTGSGKGGTLATADLRFTDEDLHLECFNRQ